MNPYMLAGLLGLGLMGRDRVYLGQAPIEDRSTVSPDMLSGTLQSVVGDRYFQPGLPVGLTPAMNPEFAPPSDVQMRAGISPEMYGAEMIGTPSAPDLSWMDTVSPSQMSAIGTGALPGTANLGMLGSLGSSLLRQAQAKPDMPVGQITRGNPQAVNYGPLMDLLAPKRVAQRKLSLL